MAETVCVNFSGPALAFLLYENVKSRHEQEGFLLGDMNVIVKKTITDTDSHNVKLHKVININAVVPCPRTCLFYNNAGAVEEEKLEDLLGTQKANVVAWFRYEPENKFKLTLRGKIIHKGLSKMFSIPPELFSCCLLSSTKSHLGSTHTYTHKFQRIENKQFITVPFHIDNLGEPSNCYKPKVHASKLFLKLCQSLSIPKQETSDWQSIDTIQDKLHSEVTKMMKSLSKSEVVKGQLESEILQLRQQLEFQKSILADKANAQNEQDEVSDSEVSLMDVDLNKLSEDESKCEEEPSPNKDLNHDLSFANDSNAKKTPEENLTKKEINANKAVNEKKARNVVGEIPKKDKTDEDKFIKHTNIANTSSAASPLSTTNAYSETNLIDLTLTDEDDLLDVSPKKAETTKKMSYSQAATTVKRNTTQSS